MWHVVAMHTRALDAALVNPACLVRLHDSFFICAARAMASRSRGLTTARCMHFGFQCCFRLLSATAALAQHCGLFSIDHCTASGAVLIVAFNHLSPNGCQVMAWW